MTALAIDTSNNIWVSNVASGQYSADTLTEFNNTGNFLRTATLSSTNFDNAVSLAFDPSGNLWTNNSDTLDGIYNLLEFSSTGSLLHTDSPSGMSTSRNIAIDGSRNVWVANGSSVGMVQVTSSGTVTASNSFTGGGISADTPTFLALDASGNVWDLGTSATLSAITGTGNALTGSPFTVLSGATGSALAIDGQNHIYAGTYIYNANNSTYTYSINPFDDAGSALAGSSGFTQQHSAGSLAFDGSGNLWITGNYYINEVIGLGAPVETPVAQAVKDNCIAQRPCTQG